MTNPRPVKPLGCKAYGSIGHLPQSRVGPGDWHVHEGQARICLEAPRKGDRIIVTEKLDGACMSVANIDGHIVALSRAGYRAADALYSHLKLFAGYIDRQKPVFLSLLAPGERLCGEWMALAHGTRYNWRHLTYEPFLPFDIIRDGKRILRDEFRRRLYQHNILPAACLWDSNEPLSIEAMENFLGHFGHHGALDPAEGAVWRVEREGRVDFLAKYVRPGKVDGSYLPGTSANVTDGEPIWNWHPGFWGAA